MYITQGLHRQVQQQADSSAIRSPERDLTFSELQQRVARLAGALKTLGVASGERVAMLSLNSHRYIEYYLAVPWADAVVNPINNRWSAAEIAYALNDSQTSVLIVDDAFKALASEVIEQATSVRQVIHAGAGDAPPGMLSYEALLAAAAPIEDVRRRDDSLYGIFYTGGTTGTAKGVMLSHNNLSFSSLTALAAGNCVAGAVYLHVMPMFHLAGFSAINSLLISGATHVVLPSFAPQAVLETISRERVTQVLLAPTMIQMLLRWCDDHPQEAARLDLSSLKRILYGASPITPALLDRACQAFPSASFSQGYGMTELSPTACRLEPEHHSAEGQASGKMYSAGRAMDCVEVLIVDENDDEVARGTVGEIVVRGPTVMLGYWNRPEETARALRNGWMHTDDCAWMDDEGFVYIVDRLKDMIISGGENIYSSEVESALSSHPAVAQCAVIGIPSEQWGESVHAVIVLKPGTQTHLDDLQRHCRERIAGYKCLRSVEFRDSLPLSGVGKVLKTELRKPFWSDNPQPLS